MDDSTPLSGDSSPGRTSWGVQVPMRIIMGFGALNVSLSIGLKKGTRMSTSLSNIQYCS